MIDRPLLARSAVATSFCAGLVLASALWSGADLAMEAMYAGVVLLAVAGIAVFVTHAHVRVAALMVWLAATMVVFDLVSSSLVAKRELFDGWYVIYPGGVAFFGLIAIAYRGTLRALLHISPRLRETNS